MSGLEPLLLRGALIRAVEEELLRLFAAGKLTGTTHTCIGQELSAVALAESLDRSRDVVFSNHRCHGHYLAWTDDVEGLVAEVLGKATGVCAGLGGSQHLCAPAFFSNGVQGGIVPVAAGIALEQKLSGRGGLVAVCIGDGTLGEGVVYETFNIAAKWRLPLLVVLENNGYAQSTSQSETLAGDIRARAEAFGMSTFAADTWNPAELLQVLSDAARLVRTASRPAFVRVDTYRLAAHSKGDDERDPEEIARYLELDLIHRFVENEAASGHGALDAIESRVRRAVASAEAAPHPVLDMGGDGRRAATASDITTEEPATQLAAINAALFAWLSTDPNLLILGEDVRSPYGGAFKVTRGLSDAFPDRVLNTPISEAAIVGIGSGLGLAGRRAVVEIMFGDFLGLCFDQVLNHAAKFRGMYDGKVRNPLVIRTPMGGGRGYGPTHSQNLEKHFAGIPGLIMLVLHGRTRIGALYAALRQLGEPVLIIENKLLYRESAAAPLPPRFAISESGGRFPATLLRPAAEPDLTVVAFGRMSVLAEAAARRLAEEEEIYLDLVFPLEVWPLSADPIIRSVRRTGKLLVIEEGAMGFDLGSEVISQAAIAHDGERPLRARRIAGRPVPIPNAVALESAVLPTERDVLEACLELFDA